MMNAKSMDTRVQQSASLALFVALLGTAGCKNFFPPLTTTTGTGTTVVNTGDYAYIASAPASTNASFPITGFSVGSGTLAAISGGTVTIPFAPSSIVVTPANNFLYVGGSGAISGAIYGYTIASSGSLTAIENTSNLPTLATANVAQMVVSPDGNWLLALDATPDGNIVTIDEYAINTSTGQLAPGKGAQYVLTGGASINPSGIAISPDGDFLAVALGTGGDVLFTFTTSTGALSAVSQVGTGSSSGADQAVAFDSTSTILFIAQSGSGGGVYPFVISDGGQTLTKAVGAPFPLGIGPSSMLVDASGKYLYVGNKADGTISGFTIGTGGVLTALSGSPYAAGVSVSALGEDNSGKYILSTSLGSPDLKMYSIDAAPAGQLAPATTALTGDGTEPARALAIALTNPSTN